MTHTRTALPATDPDTPMQQHRMCGECNADGPRLGATAVCGTPTLGTSAHPDNPACPDCAAIVASGIKPCGHPPR